MLKKTDTPKWGGGSVIPNREQGSGGRGEKDACVFMCVYLCGVCARGASQEKAQGRHKLQAFQ